MTRSRGEEGVVTMSQGGVGEGWREGGVMTMSQEGRCCDHVRGGRGVL